MTPVNYLLIGGAAMLGYLATRKKKRKAPAPPPPPPADDSSNGGGGGGGGGTTPTLANTGIWLWMKNLGYAVNTSQHTESHQNKLAVTNFQKNYNKVVGMGAVSGANKIDVDGLVGPQTIGAMNFVKNTLLPELQSKLDTTDSSAAWRWIVSQ